MFEKYNNINKSGYHTCREWTQTGYPTGTAFYNIREEKYRTLEENVEESTSL